MHADLGRYRLVAFFGRNGLSGPPCCLISCTLSFFSSFLFHLLFRNDFMKLSNLRIGMRLGLGFFTVLAFLVIVAILGIHGMGQI